jgi:hypothetical protein
MQTVTKILKDLSEQGRKWAALGVSTAAKRVDKAAGLLKVVEGRLNTFGAKLVAPKAAPVETPKA